MCSLWFPEKEVKRGGVYAFIALEAGGADIVKVSAIRGRVFHCAYGSFRLNKKYRYICGDSDMYFYDQTQENPLRVSSLIDVQDYLLEAKKSALLKEDILKITGRGEMPSDEQESKRYFEDQATLISKMGSRAVEWLNDFYSEDVIAKADIIGTAAHKERFKLKNSGGVFPFIPQKNPKNIAMVVINDEIIDFDESVTITQEVIEIGEKEEEKELVPMAFVNSAKYGKFARRETKTRYRYGKSNIYLVAVRSIPKPGGTEEIDWDKEFPPNPKPEVDATKKQWIGKPKEIIDWEKKERERQKAISKKKRELERQSKQLQKERKEEAKYNIPEYTEPVFPETISINATTYLPKLKANDPILTERIYHTVSELKLRKDQVSKPLKKTPINPMLIFVVGFILILAIAIINMQVIAPAQQAEKDYKLKLAEIQAREHPGNGTNVTGGPSSNPDVNTNKGGGGFGEIFPIPKIPGFG